MYRQATGVARLARNGIARPNARIEHTRRACGRAACRHRVLVAVPWRRGTGAEARRRAAPVPSRQSAEHLDPRGVQPLHRRALHAGVQQPRHLRPVGAAEQRQVDRARPRRIVELERGQDRAHLQAAPRREMARRLGVHRRRRRVHLQPADRPGARQAQEQPARQLVRQHQLRARRQRLRSHHPSQPSAAFAADAAGLGTLADLSLPRAGRADAAEADRHRPLQARLVQAVRQRAPGAQPGLLQAGQAATSTASSSTSSPARRRRC